jgi:host factor-I protein
MLTVSAGGQARVQKGKTHMKKNTNLQDAFLTKSRRQNVPLTVFLVNGFQMRGTVRGFDPFVVLLEVEGRQQMVYKHAISTVVPLSPIDLREAEEE